MAKPVPLTSAPTLLRRLLTETDESATAALFVQLCPESPALRRWLWEDFARDAKTRAQFAARLQRRASPAPMRITELAVDDTARRVELASIQAQLPVRIYGGRTWAEIEALIGQLRAGRADLTAFLLALQWRRAGNRARHSAHLLTCAAEYLDAILRTRSRAHLAQLATAMQLMEAVTPAARRAHLGFAGWWKLQLLLFVLRHPRPSYRMRELQRHLVSLGLNVDPRELRRFCTRHGISRDMRGGRPKLAASRPPAAYRRSNATRRP
jgi:hypothetical protein